MKSRYTLLFFILLVSSNQYAMTRQSALTRQARSVPSHVMHASPQIATSLPSLSLQEPLQPSISPIRTHRRLYTTESETSNYEKDENSEAKTMLNRLKKGEINEEEVLENIKEITRIVKEEQEAHDLTRQIGRGLVIGSGLGVLLIAASNYGLL